MQPGPTSPPPGGPDKSPPPPPDEVVAEKEAPAPLPLPLPAADADAEARADDDDDVVKAAAAGRGAREDKGARRGTTASARGRKRRRRGGGGGLSSYSTSSSPAAPAAASGATRGVVMVKRDLLARCMTCPLCRRLLRDATTISECLHTFCRKCIYQKFDDEEVECCPVCQKHLGCTPTEKLRADHSLQDVRSKLFPFKRKKINAEEVQSSITLPTKIKERSISSLVVDTPKVKPTGFTGRQTRAVARKAAAAASALRELGPSIEDNVKKEIDSCDSHSRNSNLPANSSKAPQTRRQISPNAEVSNHSSNKDTEGDSKDELADKSELWRPLNCLVEAANRTKSFRSSSQSPVIKGEQINGSTSGAFASKAKAKENLEKSNTEDDKKDVPSPPVLLKRRARKRKDLQAPTDVKPDAVVAQSAKKLTSIWFSLIASFDQQGDPPLPQIPSHYLRIKDGNVPASSIQKYLMQKLSLPSESEVEIKCCEQPVNPSQPLCNLVELWLKGTAAQTTQTMTGSSAKEFVMVLTYGRPKAPAM